MIYQGTPPLEKKDNTVTTMPFVALKKRYGIVYMELFVLIFVFVFGPALENCSCVGVGAYAACLFIS